MVLEIRFSNFFSIKDEVVLDFRAANLKSEQARLLHQNTFSIGKHEALKSIVMYGANASGKSNIFKTIQFCHAMVYESHNHNENTVFAFKPFKFDGYDKKPSSYFIRFLVEGVEYEYAFTLTQTEVVKESLHYYPKGRIKEIFTRDETRGKDKSDIYTFTDVIKRPLDVAENTSRKTLFLSRASQMDRAIPKLLFNYFHSEFILNFTGFNPASFKELAHVYKSQILLALQIADSDIIDFELKPVWLRTKNVKADILLNTASIEDVEEERLEIITYHSKDPKVGFNLMLEESKGTQRLFFLIVNLLDIITHNKVLLIDEIEDSFHPKIIEYIINLFHAGNGAQLLCSTHNTSLLNLKKFRKDQLFFVNKTEDASSDVYSIYDYKDFRETMDAEKAYLQGRFDAIPYTSDTTEMLNQLLHEQES
ncbi:ATP-binding protein [bacterium]|nr:MAG: ATP-binding protein [bacterium]